MFDHLKTLLKEIYLRTRLVLLRPFLFLRKTISPPHDKVKRILFLRHDRIGDMVLSTAALKALRKGYPSATITVFASGKNYEILKNNPNIDDVIIYYNISSPAL
jgi:hypothetical protein